MRKTKRTARTRAFSEVRGLLPPLSDNVGIALLRERLLERVCRFDFDGDERTVDVHVRRLRAKIEEEAKLPPMVQTIHGFGYKFSRSDHRCPTRFR